MTRALGAGFILATTFSGLRAQSPPLPTDIPVWLVGHPGIDGTRLRAYEGVRYTMGRAGKEGPLALGETVQAAAFQVRSLREGEHDGRAVWVRTAEIFRAGESTPVVIAEIVLDRRTLAPLESSVTRGGAEVRTVYDWNAHTIRVDGAEDQSLAIDLGALEAGAHETWMAAIPWDVGLRSMLPAVLGVGGGKWWVVPRVTGTEPIDIGDGVARDAWVVELDWWGMGASGDTHTPGGGVNGTAGPGGQYWILVDPPPGVPPVVRIRTEVDDETDSVIQIQGG